MQFRDLYCIRHGCTLRDFEENLIHRYFQVPARAALPLLERLWPDYLVEERAFAGFVGRQIDAEGIQLEVDLYHAKCVDMSFFRKHMGLRLRCRMLIAHANSILSACKPDLARMVEGSGDTMPGDDHLIAEGE